MYDPSPPPLLGKQTFELQVSFLRVWDMNGHNSHDCLLILLQIALKLLLVHKTWLSRHACHLKVNSVRTTRVQEHVAVRIESRSTDNHYVCSSEVKHLRRAGSHCFTFVRHVMCSPEQEYITLKSNCGWYSESFVRVDRIEMGQK